MEQNKRFYWIKLNTNFFIQREIKSIRKKEDGLLVTVIYLKLLLLSANYEGFLRFENTEDTFVDELAIEIDEETEDVRKAIETLASKNLIELISNDEYFLNKVPEMVGSETASAQKMRKLRAKRKKEKSQSVTLLRDVRKCDTEIDKDKDKDKEIEIDKDIDDDIEKITFKINNLIEKKTSSSSIESFIKSYGIKPLNTLINEINKSDYLKTNIDFNNLNENFINKAISGKYRTYTSELDVGENEYGKVKPFEC